MNEPLWLATQFEQKRRHLREVAYRMLGSVGDAEDAVQETWLRLTRSDTAAVDNLGGWLTTVTARVCLDMLRSRRSRRNGAAKLAVVRDAPDPTREALVADSVAAALLVVLETLTPAERVAFVLRDMFDLSFDEIGRVLDRSEAATRQLASRARRRVQQLEPPADTHRAARHVVDAFFVASREGDFDALLAVLDPDVVVRADELAIRTAAKNGWRAPALVHETTGAHAVASTFKGRARGATQAIIDGEPGAAWVVHGRTRAAFVFTVEADRILAIDLVMEPDALAELDIVLVGNERA